MNKELIVQMAGAFGWQDMGPQKNAYMISFKNETGTIRLNVYFTTMTVTVQHIASGSIQSHRDVEMAQFERILTDTYV